MFDGLFIGIKSHQYPWVDFVCHDVAIVYDIQFFSDGTVSVIVNIKQ